MAAQVIANDGQAGFAAVQKERATAWVGRPLSLPALVVVELTADKELAGIIRTGQ